MQDRWSMAEPSGAEDGALRAIVEGVEAETGEEFFRSLVRHRPAAGEHTHVADELPGIDVQNRPREHPGGGEKKVAEADPRESEGVVEQVERKHGREAEEEDDLPPFSADGAVDGREARIGRD